MAETTTRTVQVRIMDVRRQLNTPAGNPVYKLIGRNGSFTTEPDASVGYEVRDWVPDVGVPAKLELNRRGRVVGIEYL